MTLFVDRIPERQRRDIFEFESSTSEAVGAAVEQTFFENPSTAVRRISELDEALYGPYDYGSPGPGPGREPRRIGPQTPLLTAEEARNRANEQGLELDIPEEGLPEGALNILMERKSAERKRQIILSSAPSGSFPITLAASFAASAIDPVNIASAFVPIFGEARIAGMLAKAGTAGGRFATRAGIGAVEGVAGAAIVEPLILAASAQDQADYDMSDSLLNVAFGGVLGGGLHSIGGYVSDLFNPIRIQHEAAIRAPETIEIPEDVSRGTSSPEVQGESLSRPENIRPDLVDPINIEVELRRQMETDIANTAMARAQAEILPELIQELEPLAGTRIREVGDLKREQVDLERRQSMIEDTFKERAKDFQSEGMTRKRAEKAARESIAQEKAEIDQRLAAITNQLDETQAQGRAREDLERVREGVIPERYLDRVNQRADEIRRGAQPKPLASAVKTAREIASEAPHSVRAAALQSAIAQAMDGQPVDVENLFKLMSKPDEALNAIKTQQRVYDKEAEAFSAKVDRIVKAEKDDFESLKASTEYEEQIVNEMLEQTRASQSGASDAIGRSLSEKIKKDFDAAVAEYNQRPDAKGGKVLNTDIGRELSPEYLADRTQSSDVHEPASQFIKTLYAKKLKDAPKPGERPVVLFTAGGTGAGKSTAVKSTAAVDEAQIIYDTNMNKYSTSRQKVDQALKAGKDVTIVAVYREPVEALVNGALPRAVRQEAEFGTGRTVPLGEHLKTHRGFPEVITRLYDEFQGDPRVTFQVIDNSHGRGGQRLADIDLLRNLDHTDLVAKLDAALEQEYAKGTISEAIYQGFKQDARTVDQRPRPEDGRGPEETNLDDVNLSELIPELAEADALATNAQVYSRAWRAFAVCSLGA